MSSSTTKDHNTQLVYYNMLEIVAALQMTSSGSGNLPRSGQPLASVSPFICLAKKIERYYLWTRHKRDIGLAEATAEAFHSRVNPAGKARQARIQVKVLPRVFNAGVHES